MAIHVPEPCDELIKYDSEPRNELIQDDLHIANDIHDDEDVSNGQLDKIDKLGEAKNYYFQPSSASTVFETESVCSEFSNFSKQSKRVLRSKKLQQITSDGDVWYERRMKNKKTGKKKSWFVSANTGEHVKDEPPSGASCVVYADDYTNYHQTEEHKSESISPSLASYNITINAKKGDTNLSPQTIDKLHDTIQGHSKFSRKGSGSTRNSLLSLRQLIHQ